MQRASPAPKIGAPAPSTVAGAFRIGTKANSPAIKDATPEEASVDGTRYAVVGEGAPWYVTRHDGLHAVLDGRHGLLAAARTLEEALAGAARPASETVTR